MIPNKVIKSISLSLLVATIWPCSALALSSDRSQPMELEADQAELDDRRKVSIYSGNVKIIQGSMQLNADQVTLHSKGNNIAKLVMEGRPAQYRQRPDGKSDDVRAQATRMEYYGDKNEIVLLGAAKINQLGNVFQSNRIVYDIGRDLVTAGKSTDTNNDDGSPQESGRVQITIQPTGDGSSDNTP